MTSLFRVVIDRVLALLTSVAAAELEAQALARDAERRAELLRQAERYEDEGLHGLAAQLCLRAEEVTAQRPLAGVLPALRHLHTDTPAIEPTALLQPRKKGGT